MSKTTTIKGSDIGPLTITDAGNTVNIAKGASYMIGGDLSGSLPMGLIIEDDSNPSVVHDNIYNIAGRVLGVYNALYTIGDGDRITIGAAGALYGIVGLTAAGDNNVITNNGKIIAAATSDAASAVMIDGSTGTTFSNNGLISGEVGISFMGDKSQIVNGVNGTIFGNDAGISLQVLQGGSLDVVNHGRIVGSNGVAIEAEGTKTTIVNDGTLKGAVHLGDGDDTLDNRGGTITNVSITGGYGDDTLIVDSSKYVLIEKAGQGNDTVKSSVSYKLSGNVENLYLFGSANTNGFGTNGAEKLHGGATSNTLKGYGGSDHLYGGKGTDTLWGGDGKDVFHFNKGDGHDSIMDFVHLQDRIDLAGWTGVTSLALVKSHGIDQSGGVMITSGTDSLFIAGAHEANLTTADFIF